MNPKRKKGKRRRQKAKSSDEPGTSASTPASSTEEFSGFSDMSSADEDNYHSGCDMMVKNDGDNYKLVVKEEKAVKKKSMCNHQVCTDPSNSTVLIMCDSCNFQFHLKCINMTNSFHDFYIKNKHTGNFWFCKTCSINLNKKVPDEKVLQDKIDELEKKFNTFNNITNVRLYNLEKQTKENGSTSNIISTNKNSNKVNNINNSKNTNTPAPIKHQIVITPDENNKFNSTKTFAEQVKNSLSNVQVKKLAVTRSGQGIINFPDPKNRDSAMNVLDKKYNAKSQDLNFRNLMPKIQLFDLCTNDYPDSDSKTKENLKINITNKNPGIKCKIEEGKCFEILLIKPDGRRPGFSSAIIKVDPEILQTIKDNDYRLFIDFSSCRVNTHIAPTQCFTCQSFHHKSNSPICKHVNSNKKTCLYCGEDHSSKDCVNKKNSQLHKCANCIQARLKNVNHTSTDKRCPIYQKQVEIIRSKTIGMENVSKNLLRSHATTNLT